MNVTLVPSGERHTQALEQLVQSFVQEVGYYFGRERDADGVVRLPGMTDRELANPHRYVIEEDGQPVGFVDWTDLGGEDGYQLAAIYVSTGQRRRHIASQALRALFTERPGTWTLAVPTSFGPGEVFAGAVVRRFGRSGMTTRRTLRRGAATLNQVTFSAGTEGVVLPVTGRVNDFEFDRSHHKQRRTILIWAVVTPLLGMLLSLLTAEEPAMSALIYTVAMIATVILWLVYLETVVTGILDRQDRGPIVKPHWLRSQDAPK